MWKESHTSDHQGSKRCLKLAMTQESSHGKEFEWCLKLTKTKSDIREYKAKGYFSTPELGIADPSTLGDDEKVCLWTDFVCLLTSSGWFGIMSIYLDCFGCVWTFCPCTLWCMFTMSFDSIEYQRLAFFFWKKSEGVYIEG